jgi:O-antigen/teichoic acid export membrane protein
MVVAASISTVRRLLRLVTSPPIDTSTEEGRARERYRRAALTAATGGVARAATIISALIVVPLCIDQLGNERYGMWLTLSSLFSFAYVADLGVTAGLQLAIAGADGKDDREAARRYVSTALSILLKTCGLGAMVLAILYVAVDWSSVFNVSSPRAVAEAGAGAMAFGGIWLVNTLTAVVMRVQYGYQRGYVTNLWQILGSVLTVVAVVTAVALDGGLPLLVIAAAGMPAIALLLNGIQLFGWHMRWLRPSPRHVDRDASRKLLRDGAWYLLAGLAYNAVYLSCNMLVAQWLGAGAVPEFGVPYRVAAVLTLLLAVIVNALLPAYAEAAERGDRRWLRRALIRSLSIATVLGGFGAVVYVVAGKWVISLWVGDAVSPTYTILIGLGVWALVSAIANGLNSFVQGTGGVRSNGLQWLAAAIVSVPAQMIAIHTLGVDGVPWALAATELLCRLLPGALYYRAWLVEGQDAR